MRGASARTSKREGDQRDRHMLMHLCAQLDTATIKAFNAFWHFLRRTFSFSLLFSCLLKSCRPSGQSWAAHFRVLENMHA